MDWTNITDILTNHETYIAMLVVTNAATLWSLFKEKTMRSVENRLHRCVASEYRGEVARALGGTAEKKIRMKLLSRWTGREYADYAGHGAAS